MSGPGRKVKSQHLVRVRDSLCPASVDVTLEVPPGYTVRVLGMLRGDPGRDNGLGSVMLELQVATAEAAAFNPAFDMPTTPREAIAMLEAWGSPRVGTFRPDKAAAAAALLRDAFTLAVGKPGG